MTFASCAAAKSKSWKQRDESPEGTTDNSPPFQRRVQFSKAIRVPKGRKKTRVCSRYFCRPFGALSFSIHPHG
jgi:hypothetical protein